MSAEQRGEKPLPNEVRLDAADYEPDGDWIEVGNEFATVAVRRVLTRNGARLQISSSRLETDVFLDSVLLESLTWQTPESFSLFLETPLEPLQAREEGQR